MKTLAEFDTLAEAKAYTQTRGKMIHRNSMNAWLSGAGKYRRLKAIAADEAHPLGDGAAAFLDSTEYNLIQSSETGQGVIALMQALIAAEGNDSGLQAVLDKAIASANETILPYANVSEYEWRKARGEGISKKQVTPVNGWLKITLTQDVEAHRPQVHAEVQGTMQRVTGFGVVEKAGDYLAQVPRGYSVLYVDDAYEAIA
jgi:hypothetical protein